MNYIEQEKARIIASLGDTGFAISHVYHLLTDEQLHWFEKCQEYYKVFVEDPSVKHRIDRLWKRDPIVDRGKVFELTHADLLGGPLQLDTGAFIHLYSNPTFLDIACAYLGQEPVMRNVATWIHSYTPFITRERSQRWHRDTEDNRILKIWMYYSDVTAAKGALQYVKNSRYEDKNDSIWPNYDRSTDSWPTHGYLNAEATSQIPVEDIVTAIGEVGTIVFGDTNGFHRGGQLDSPGIRLKTQCCYLRPNAYQVRKGPLQVFDHNPTSGNICDKNHPLYGTLSTRAKKALE
jgi:hypothetical protein